MAQVAKYYVNAAMRTNLDSMYTSLTNIIYDMMNGLYSEKEIMGKRMNFDEVWGLRAEVEYLYNKADFGKVTGKEYGRIKAISDERNMWRYSRCIASGMSEDKAAYAFME